MIKTTGITAAFICEKLGVSRTYLHEARSNKRNIDDIKLNKIAEILGTTPEYLRDETDDPGIPGKDTGDDLKDVQFAFTKLTGDPTEITEEDMNDVRKILLLMKEKRKRDGKS